MYACHRVSDSDYCCYFKIIRAFCLIVPGIPILLRCTPLPLPSPPAVVRDNGEISVQEEKFIHDTCQSTVRKTLFKGGVIKICVGTTAPGSCGGGGEIRLSSEYNKREWKFIAKERGWEGVIGWKITKGGILYKPI